MSVGVRRWPITGRETVGAALLSGGIAIFSLLLYGAPPLLNCWMGVGPAPEPATSQCITRLRDASSPFQRLQYDQPLVADMAILLAAFVAAFVVILVVATVARRVAR
jgi:hypothetical protein